MQFQVIVVTDPQIHPQTNPQTGPIIIHCAAKLSMQCKNEHQLWTAMQWQYYDK